MIGTIGKTLGLILPFLLVIISTKLSHSKRKVTKVSIIISVVIVLIIFVAVGIYTSNLLMNI